MLWWASLDRQAIIARLRENEASLKARGVAHAALVGSRARGDTHPDSDTDIMIEIDPAARIGVYEYVGLFPFFLRHPTHRTPDPTPTHA